MKKNAQIMGQVFIFILAGALFILILTYGYKAIAGFSERSEQVALVEFQTNLESSVKSISRFSASKSSKPISSTSIVVLPEFLISLFT